MAQDDPREERKRDDKGGRWRRDEEDYVLPPELAAFGLLSLVLGRASNRSVTVSALAKEPMEVYFEYGTAPGAYNRRTALLALAAGVPVESVFDNLLPNTEYFYRTQFRKPGVAMFDARPECRFHTQRAAGSTFTFGVQGDTHPERPQMSHPSLYARTLLQASAAKPDFHICMGDDFSVEKLREINADTLAQPYLLQRPFLGLIGQSAPVFLLNGNHEQASLANYNQSDIRHDVAVGVQNARNHYFPTIAPDGFYTGNAEPMQSIGAMKDYYAWTWGDALFVVLDPFRYSVRQRGGGGDGWGWSLGLPQYQWLKQTLEQSGAKYKFVFLHNLLCGDQAARGGVEVAAFNKWGGKNADGSDGFKEHRPGWDTPIHQLLVRNRVAAVFKAHDNFYAQQELDGIVYQMIPQPSFAGNDRIQDLETYGYKKGTFLGNSGHVRVSVAHDKVTVEYVRSWHETPEHKNGEVAHRYSIH